MGQLEITRKLLQKIDQKSAVVGVLGLGHVGLPLSMMFAKKFMVFGFDTDKKRIKQLMDAESHVKDVPKSLLASLLRKSFFPTSDESDLSRCDFILISVPTPLTKSNEPDLTYVKEGSEIIMRNLRRGQFVILESTTYPGTTETVVVPILERSGLKAGRDFGVAYSPERVDPGNEAFTIENTPKVLGGINEESTTIASRFYESVVDRVVAVRDCRTAEATKMLENIFRAVNIALVNEMAIIFDRMDINTWEVVEAAASKPYGFMPFSPGPGIGGHCIPVDPHYMAYRAKQIGLAARFIELSGEVNEFMKFHVVNLLVEALSKVGKSLKDSTIAVFGLAYKKDTKDTRGSPATKIIEEISHHGGNIRTYDPHVKYIETEVGILKSKRTVEDAIRGADAILFLTNHDSFAGILDDVPLERMNGVPIIVDTRNVLERTPANTIYIGLGKGKSKPDIEAGYSISPIRPE